MKDVRKTFKSVAILNGQELKYRDIDTKKWYPVTKPHDKSNEEVQKWISCVGRYDKSNDTLEIIYKMNDSEYNYFESVMKVWFPKIKFRDRKYENINAFYVDDDMVRHQYKNQEIYLHDVTFLITKADQDYIYDKHACLCFGADKSEMPYSENREIFYQLFFDGTNSILSRWEYFH